MFKKFNILGASEVKDDIIEESDKNDIIEIKPQEMPKNDTEYKKITINSFINKVNEGKMKKKALVDELKELLTGFYNSIDEDNLII